MSTTSEQHRSVDIVEGTSGALVGLGIVTMALFPLSLPILALTAVALLPLLIPPLALGLVVAVLAVPILLVRRLARRLSRTPSRRPYSAPRPAGEPAPGRSS